MAKSRVHYSKRRARRERRRGFSRHAPKQLFTSRHAETGELADPMKTITRTLNNNRGSLTVDYMFALVLVIGFCLVIMAFSTTLVTVEVVQYAAYAGARRYFAGNLCDGEQTRCADSQQAAGQAAIQSVLSNSVIAPLVQNGWFTIGDNSGPFYVGQNVASAYPSFGQAASLSQPYHDTFDGAVIPFQANILAFQIPGFGQTIKANYAGNKGGGFTVDINSFLGREPTFDECKSFWDNRWQQIQKLNSSYGQAGSTGVLGGSTTQAVEVIDNGC